LLEPHSSCELIIVLSNGCRHSNTFKGG